MSEIPEPNYYAQYMNLCHEFMKAGFDGNCHYTVEEVDMFRATVRENRNIREYARTANFRRRHVQ